MYLKHGDDFIHVSGLMPLYLGLGRLVHLSVTLYMCLERLIHLIVMLYLFGEIDPSQFLICV